MGFAGIIQAGWVRTRRTQQRSITAPTQSACTRPQPAHNGITTTIGAAEGGGQRGSYIFIGLMADKRLRLHPTAPTTRLSHHGLAAAQPPPLHISPLHSWTPGAGGWTPPTRQTRAKTSILQFCLRFHLRRTAGPPPVARMAQ